MVEAKPLRVYSEAEIAGRLRSDLPHWRFSSGYIVRRYRTAGWKATLMAVNAVGHLAEAAWHHPDLRVSYAWLEVALKTDSANGVTDKDFELARRIEDVVGWRPGEEGGALEGTPDDPRWAYLKYD